jgi:hypothetical protein
MGTDLESSPTCVQKRVATLSLNVSEEVFLLLVRKMTDTKIEQRTNIKFLAKLKNTATETYQLLRHEHVSLNGTEGF